MFDGHGGDLAAQWLQQELHTRLAPHVGPALLQPDPAAEVVSVQTGLRRPGTASTMFEQVFQSTDADLLKYLHGERCALWGWCAPAAWGQRSQFARTKRLQTPICMAHAEPHPSATSCCLLACPCLQLRRVQ